MSKKSKVLFLAIIAVLVALCFILVACNKGGDDSTSYTITYNLDDGTNSESNPTSYDGTAEIELSSPTKDGYDFAGWYSDSEFTTLVTKIAVGETGNIALFAKWEAIPQINPTSYTITYSLDGGTNSVSNPISYDGTAEITFSSPTKSGYLFRGWYSDSEYTTAITKIAVGQTGNKTIYAKWEIITYTITYNMDGGTNVASNPTSYDGTAEITFSSPTKSGYLFRGWYSDSEYTTAVTAIAVGQTGNKTIYAKWEIISYTITYNLDGGTNSASNPTSYDGTVEIVLNSSTKNGYVFAGWYSDNEFTTLITKIAVGRTGTITLFARWEAATEGLSYTLNLAEDGYDVDVGTATASEILIPSVYNNGLPVTTVKADAFSGCSAITSITIPSSVTSIGNSAFSGCSGLTSIIVPDSVTSIGNSAFNGCSGLTSITLPFIGNLKSATTPSESTVFGYIFGSSAYLGGTEIEQCYEDDGYAINYFPSNLTSLTVTGGRILYGTFESYSWLANLTLGSGVTEIGDYAFYGCSDLTSVTIPAGVPAIGNSAFSGCDSLESVIIESGVTEIGDDAFNGCGGLTSVTIPSSVTSIGRSAFYDCGLTSVTIPSSVTAISDSAFYSCNGLTSLTIPSSIISIGNFAFYYCNGLTTLTIPNSVTSIGTSAFNNCSGLTTLTIPNSVTSIGNSAFKACSGLTTFTIGTGVTAIGDEAFGLCYQLTALSIPVNVTSIGDSAFFNCNRLTSITVDSENTAYHSDGDCLIETASNTLLLGCQNSVIPNDGSVTSISNNAFYNCTNLTSITIPSSVISIGSNAFRGCSGLTTITIPANVTQIGNFAFYGCSALTSVTFDTTAGWYVTTVSSATSGTNVIVTDASTNATNFKTTYYNYYWKRNA